MSSTASPRQGDGLLRYGRLISPEWKFAKALEILKAPPEVYATIEHWVDAADWIVWQLTGDYSFPLVP